MSIRCFRPRCWPRVVRVAVLALISLLPVSCTTFSVPEKVSEKRELQWPPLPLMPRIVWVREIGDYQDAGIGKGFWQRVVEVIAGPVETRIGKPYGVYADERQRLFIVDVSYAVVHVMDLKEKRYSVIGAGKDRVFKSPIAITEDDQGNVYITDSGAGVVYRYNLNKGQLQPFIISELGRPTGIAFNRRNHLLYVTDTTQHQVVAFDLKGNMRFRVGSHGDAPGHFNYPTDLFVDRTGRLYVTDALNSRITIFNADGGYLRTFGRAGDTGGNFAKPKGVAVDSDGNIYVCDALLDAVQIFNAEGQLLLTFGSNGVDAGQFWMPAGIYIDGKDTIYVADAYNRRVQVFRYLHMDSAPAGRADKVGGR